MTDELKARALEIAVAPHCYANQHVRQTLMDLVGQLEKAQERISFLEELIASTDTKLIQRCADLLQERIRAGNAISRLDEVEAETARLREALVALTDVMSRDDADTKVLRIEHSWEEKGWIVRIGPFASAAKAEAARKAIAAIREKAKGAGDE